MIETIHLQPPHVGLRSNPVLFGIAEAIADLIPVRPEDFGKALPRWERCRQAPGADDAASGAKRVDAALCWKTGRP